MSRITFSEGSVADLMEAHSQFLGDIADVGKGSRGYGYTYADLASILGECRPALCNHGLSLTQFPTFAMYPAEMRMTMPADSKGFAPVVIGEVVIVTTLAHKSGQWMRGELSIPVETMKNLSVAQAVGAAVSYARRYHASAILAIAQEDNDAARQRDDAPMGKGQPRQERQARPAARQPRVELAQAGTVAGLKERIERMGRNPAQFAKAVAGVSSLEQLPATAVEAAQKMLAKAEALHYQEKKEAEAAQQQEQEASAAQSAEQEADQTQAYDQQQLAHAVGQ